MAVCRAARVGSKHALRGVHRSAGRGDSAAGVSVDDGGARVGGAGGQPGGGDRRTIKGDGEIEKGFRFSLTLPYSSNTGPSPDEAPVSLSGMGQASRCRAIQLRASEISPEMLDFNLALASRDFNA